jgi:rod shape-determining protein MreC
MDFILGRYRNLSVLLLVVFGQLLLLAYQVRSNQQVRVLRVWAVTSVAPMARVLENVRSSVHGFFSDYFILLDVREDNRRLTAENNRLKLENNFLNTELSTADRAKALIEFKGRSPSNNIAARIIATSTSANTVVLVDRGTSDGVYKGMAVITGDGIVGKVLDSFPLAAQVQLITDKQFGAGVVSQKNHVYGTLLGQGFNRCRIDRIQNEEKVEPDEMFYTTGEDRVFPKGLPVGRVVSVQAGPTFKSIEVVPTGIKNGLEEVLIVLEGVHQEIPPPPSLAARISLMPAPTAKDGGAAIPAGTPSTGVLTTDADRLVDRYRNIEQQRGGTKFGAFGSQAPSFATIPTTPASNDKPASSTAAPAPAAIKPPEKPVPEKPVQQQQ